MKYRVSLLALVFSLGLNARPLLIPPRHLALPAFDIPQYLQGEPVYSSIAIDGDTVIVAAERAANANNDRVRGVYYFQRATDGRWNFTGSVSEGAQVPEFVQLGGDVATVSTGSGGFRIYERLAPPTWVLTATIGAAVMPFRIENGSIFTRTTANGGNGSCLEPYGQYRKVNNTWQLVATIGGARCDHDYLPDINDGRALIVSTPANSSPQPPIQIFRDANGAWPQAATITPPPPQDNGNFYLGPGAQNGLLAYFTQGGYLYRNAGGDSWQSAGRFIEPEADLGIYTTNGTAPALRTNNLLLPGREVDYELPSHDIDFFFTWNTLRVYRTSSNGAASYFARLNPDHDVWMWATSEDGRRVVAAGPDNNAGYDPVSKLYVFEIPDTYTFPSLEQDNFESGNDARWHIASGQFSVAQSNGTHVLRQSNLTGDAVAVMTSVDWTDQAIEADLRPTQFAESGRWFGLVTRRKDAQNYYYVTLRSPRTISLRRIRNGVITELGSNLAAQDFVAGHSYRVRLESVGDQHVVFLNGQPRVFVKDTTLTHGHPGVASYRTSFDADNVVITGGTRLLTLQDSIDSFFDSKAYSRGTGTGTWQTFAIDDEQSSFHNYLGQMDTTGDARVFSLTPLTNQVVSASLQPASFGATTGTQDPWFGIAARVVDGSNYLYLTLRRSNQLSLRRVVNGAIQVIATVPVNVSTTQTYDLRLEVVSNQVRAFVNGDLKIETTAAGLPSEGRSGVLFYKTSAYLYSWVTYQP